MSLQFPGVSKTRSGFPKPSTIAWIFVLNPPRLRPGALSPFFAPLPCWWTLIVMLSSIRVLSSTISWAISSSKTCAQTPCRLHRRKRVYTLFQGPYRSGRDLQGISVFIQYRIPLSITRLFFPDLRSCVGFSGGNSPFTLFHCSSVNSCGRF